tara:strand:+ start:815 stop:1084 length:270 start_codon:yes stop_codon:yes gene_type:complete
VVFFSSTDCHRKIEKLKVSNTINARVSLLTEMPLETALQESINTVHHSDLFPSSLITSSNPNSLPLNAGTLQPEQFAAGEFNMADPAVY